MPGFEGFPADTLAYLADLGENNDRDWFTANKKRYESAYIGPAKAFVEAIGPALQQLAPDVKAEARVNGSIFRINRDIRFSKDKRPYKDHLDLWFWDGEKKGWDCSGFFFRLTHDTLIIGAGMHQLPNGRLDDFRAAVADDGRGAALQAALGQATRGGLTVGGDQYQRVPKGFDADHPRAELLKRKGLHVTLEAPPPAELTTADFPAWCIERWRPAIGVHEWLTEWVRG